MKKLTLLLLLMTFVNVFAEWTKVGETDKLFIYANNPGLAEQDSR